MKDRAGVIQLMGYAAAALVILSVTMTSLIRLRVVGLAGAVLFVTYGLFLGAWPIVLTNSVTMSIHVMYLRRAQSRRSVSGEQPTENRRRPDPPDGHG